MNDTSPWKIHMLNIFVLTKLFKFSQNIPFKKCKSLFTFFTVSNHIKVFTSHWAAKRAWGVWWKTGGGAGKGWGRVTLWPDTQNNLRFLKVKFISYSIGNLNRGHSWITCCVFRPTIIVYFVLHMLFAGQNGNRQNHLFLHLKFFPSQSEKNRKKAQQKETYTKA